MPTVKKIRGPYRLFFFSFDCNEQMQVHTQRQRENRICKFWLEPVALVKNYGFSPKELNTIREIIKKNKGKIVEAWYEHCGENTRRKN
jgi:hypothetical protein